MSKPTPAWVGQYTAFNDALKYMYARSTGAEKSIYTPWPKFNDAATDGLEWNTLTVIGGRPGSGKTLIKDQIIRESFMLNPNDDFRVLEFQFEMVGRTSAIREFSSITGKTYKELCSAGSLLTSDTLNTCHQYAKERVKHPVDIVSTPMTVNQMREQIDMYMNLHKGKKTIITLDHTMLVKRAPYQNNTLDMMFELGEFFTQTKRDYPVMFIALSQLSRNVENRTNKRPILSDLRESGSIEQDSDLVLMLYRESYYNSLNSNTIKEQSNLVELIIAKQRNGPIGTVELEFDAKRTKFLNRNSQN
jgi:replicative DNA helicase